MNNNRTNRERNQWSGRRPGIRGMKNVIIPLQGGITARITGGGGDRYRIWELKFPRDRQGREIIPHFPFRRRLRNGRTQLNNRNFIPDHITFNIGPRGRLTRSIHLSEEGRQGRHIPYLEWEHAGWRNGVPRNGNGPRELLRNFMSGMTMEQMTRNQNQAEATGRTRSTQGRGIISGRARPRVTRAERLLKLDKMKKTKVKAKGSKDLKRNSAPGRMKLYSNPKTKSPSKDKKIHSTLGGAKK